MSNQMGTRIGVPMHSSDGKWLGAVGDGINWVQGVGNFARIYSLYVVGAQQSMDCGCTSVGVVLGCQCWRAWVDEVVSGEVMPR